MKNQGEPTPRLFDIRTFVEGYRKTSPECMKIVKELYQRQWRMEQPKDHWLYVAQGYTMRQLMKLGIVVSDEDLIPQKDYRYMPLYEFDEYIRKFMEIP